MKSACKDKNIFFISAKKQKKILLKNNLADF